MFPPESMYRLYLAFLFMIIPDIFSSYMRELTCYLSKLFGSVNKLTGYVFVWIVDAKTDRNNWSASSPGNRLND